MFLPRWGAERRPPVKLPAYPRTKPSGVEWLGDVPEHWEVKRECKTPHRPANRAGDLRPKGAAT